MFRKKRSPINLSEGEEIVACIHKHWMKVFSSAMLLSLVAIIILGVVFYVFNSYLGQTGKLIFLVVFIFLLISLVLEYHRNNQDSLFITNQRVVNFEVRGVFDKQIIEVHYDKIQSVYTSVRGIFRTIFNVGDIMIKTGAERGEIEIYFLPKPARIQSLILELQQKYVRSPTLMEHKNTEGLAVNQDTLMGLLNHLKYTDKKDHFIKPVSSPEGAAWKNAVKDYLENKEETRITKEPSYFRKKRVAG